MEDKKTVLITGASSGIGKEFAMSYARKGYELILCGRRMNLLEELRDQLGVPCESMTADLADEKRCLAFAGALKDRHIDIFINNAGFGAAGKFTETSLEKEISMLKVNDLAQHILFKTVLQKMVQEGSGTILNVVSSAGLFPGGPYMAGYYASKAYMMSLTRGVVQELKEMGSPVYVCALCPGPVDTEFNRNADVIFALKGISVQQCVSQCLKAMDRHRTVIVPSLTMKLATAFSRFVPTSWLVVMTGHQQKKKIYK